MKTFSPKMPTEDFPIALGFGDLIVRLIKDGLLPSDVTIASVTSITITDLTGVDSNPSAIRAGGPASIDGFDVIIPMAKAGLAGSNYLFDVEVLTSNSKTLHGFAVLPMRSSY